MVLAGKPGGFVVEHFINDEDLSTGEFIMDRIRAEVFNFLESSGANPQFTETSQIRFTYQGRKVNFVAFGQDSQFPASGHDIVYFGFFVENFFPVNEEDQELAIFAAASAQESMWGIKFSLVDNDKMEVAFESFAFDINGIIPPFRLIMNVLHEAMCKYVDCFEDAKRRKRATLKLSNSKQ